MVDFSHAFRLEKMRSGNAAVYLLREQFESFATSPHRAGVCEWIAGCFYELGQYEEAGTWYEAAGQLILSESFSPPVVRAMAALGKYERALDCYDRDHAEESAEECSALMVELRKVCTPT